MRTFSRRDKSTQIAWQKVDPDAPNNYHGADWVGLPVGNSNIIIRAYIEEPVRPTDPPIGNLPKTIFVSIYRVSKNRLNPNRSNDRHVTLILPPNSLLSYLRVEEEGFHSMDEVKKYVAEWWNAVKNFPSNKLCRIHEDCREHPMLARACGASRSKS